MRLHYVAAEVGAVAWISDATLEVGDRGSGDSCNECSEGDEIIKLHNLA
ncbi:hypothetical protein HHX47_DHR10000131 [Lentinula edodes]|nr:hypothetical protein HHX47_DHR10000131 [Lentinula edodes]